MPVNPLFRTDLADEAGRLFGQEDGEPLPGVRVAEETLRGLRLCRVEIRDAAGARALRKAEGLYFSLELPRWFDRGAESFPDAVLALAELIRRCLPEAPESVLVAALGNPDVTPDALGSLAASSILVTRHLKQNGDERFRDFCSLALCRPGVLGSSGMESALQIATLCRELRPALVVAIDALAGSEPERLCRTVQVSDAGICPGSGVGNDRLELSRETLGVPVVSIGVPTVIDAGAFGGDKLSQMFVTPRDIDSLVRAGARVIGYALDLALHRGLTIADVDMLLG